MSIKVWIGKKYENTQESKMVTSIISILKKSFSSTQEKCHILCNFSIPGYTKKYTSSIDMAFLTQSSLTILELKNYSGKISGGEKSEWYCENEIGEKIKIQGGKDGRTPFEQIRDYHNQMIAYLGNSITRYLNPGNQINIKHFVYGLLVFPTEMINDETVQFSERTRHWAGVTGVDSLAEKLAQHGSGRNSLLCQDEIENLIKNVFGLNSACLVGDMPLPGVEESIEIKPVQPIRVNYQYEIIGNIWNSAVSNSEKILEFQQVLKQLIWKQVKQLYRNIKFTSLYSCILELFKNEEQLFYYVNQLRMQGNFLKQGSHVSLTQCDVNEAGWVLCKLVEKFEHDAIPLQLAKQCSIINLRPIKERKRDFTNEIKVIYLEVTKIDSCNGVIEGVEQNGATDAILKVAYKDDFPELEEIVVKGNIISIVTPMLRSDGVYKASEIILEPDFLIAPTSIGNTLEFNYPEYCYWIQAIRDVPKERMEWGDKKFSLNAYTARGNIANAALAEYCAHGDASDVDIIKEYFSDNLVSFTSVLHGETRQHEQAFFNDCKEVVKNTKKMLGECPFSENSDVSWRIEAPLYCPAYGLSAQADALRYITEDEKKTAQVLELKSGKWETFRTESYKKSHIVQPMMYSDMLLFIANMSYRDCFSYLYYASKYENTWRGTVTHGKLFSVSRLREQIREYCRIRNLLVYVGLQIKNGGFKNLIEGFSADSFRKDQDEKYYANYKRKDFDILDLLRSASDIAKQYFYRFLQFVAEEEFTSRLGTSHEDAFHGNVPLWRSSLKERASSGLALSGLVAVKEEVIVDNLGRIVSILFDTSKEKDNQICSIRRGDRVCIYKMNSEDSNVTNSIVFLGTVEEIAGGTCKITMNHPQKKELLDLFNADASFVVEPSPPTFISSAYKGLYHFISGNSVRRDIVLGLNKPSYSERILPVSNSIACDDTRKILQHIWNANDMHLVWGPPGTGKTSHLMSSIVDMIMADPQQNVLLLTYTYRAADEICKMLKKRMERFPQDRYLLIGSAAKFENTEYFASIDYLGDKRVTVKDKLDNIRIVVGVVSAISPSHEIFRLKHFNMAIVDEASQLLDTHILPLFCCNDYVLDSGKPLIDKFVFIGDDKQLPAVVQQEEHASAITDRSLINLGFKNCRESFFSRMKRNLPGECCDRLSRQFRMHKSIMEFCNLYYDNNLEIGDKISQTKDLEVVPKEVTDNFERYVLSSRLGCVPVDNDRVNGSNWKSNASEAKKCARIVEIFLKYNRYSADEIVIIVPFRSQIAMVRKELSEINGSNDSIKDVTIETVERVQSATKKVVIFTTVITSVTQANMISAKLLDEIDDGDSEDVFIDQKFNVAITRTQEQFFIVGKESVLRRSLCCYGRLLDWIENYDGIYDDVICV